MSVVAVTRDCNRFRYLRGRVLRWSILAVTAAALLFLGLKTRTMLVAAVLTLAQVSWFAVLALPIFCLWTLAASAGWRALIADSGVHDVPSLARLWLIRLEAQAVNLVLPLAGVGGEALRAAVLGRHTQQGSASTASVASDITTEILACFVFVILGICLGWRAIPLTTGLRVVLVTVSAIIVAALCWLPSHLARVGRRLGDGRAVTWLRSVCQSMDGRRTSGWWRSVGWHIVEKVLIAGETWIYAHSLGLPLSVPGALFATAMMSMLSCLLFFIPAQVGAADGGIVLGLQWLGAPWSVGLAVACLRRLRQLLVAFVGLLLLGLTILWRRGMADPEQSHLCSGAASESSELEG
jgi:hypothetical protein